MPWKRRREGEHKKIMRGLQGRNTLLSLFTVFTAFYWSDRMKKEEAAWKRA
jgi:hypothetical protein